MKTIWLTYAWDDNKDGDVDFIVHELKNFGMGVKLDRWNLNAGSRLWEQIADFIQNPKESDGWVLLASQNSLGSQACREEFSYALDRALASRSETFPIIGLFTSQVDTALVPPGVKVRLCVSTTDPDWKERIRAAIEGRPPAITAAAVQPYQVRIHKQAKEDKPFLIELRPRAGTWSPFFAAVPSSEKEAVKPYLMHGPADRIPVGVVLFNSGEGVSVDGNWWIIYAQNEATPTQSYYVVVEKMPSAIAFGVHNGQPQYLFSNLDQ